MKIEKIDIKKLKHANYNPRKKLTKNDREYQKIEKSIKEFGYVDPIIVNKDYTIIGGHQRHTVLTDLGFTDVECVMLDVDKKKEKALNIALNKISGEWDNTILKDLLEELDTGDFDMELTGFDDDELEKLLCLDNKEIVKGEIEFTEELMEEHNYIILYFENSIDWQVAKEKLNIKTKKTSDSREGYERKGVGRVLRGAEVIGKIN